MEIKQEILVSYSFFNVARIADGYRHWRNILCNNAPSPDHTSAPYGNSRQNDAAATDPAVIADGNRYAIRPARGTRRRMHRMSCRENGDMWTKETPLPDGDFCYIVDGATIVCIEALTHLNVAPEIAVKRRYDHWMVALPEEISTCL